MQATSNKQLYSFRLPNASHDSDKLSTSMGIAFKISFKFAVIIWRPQWPCGVRHAKAAYLFRIRVPQVEWMSVSCECYVLLGRGVCDGPSRSLVRGVLPRGCLSECNREAWLLMWPWPTGGCYAVGGKIFISYWLLVSRKYRVKLAGFRRTGFFYIFGFGPFVPGKI